jgi:hypothetical protein
MGNAILSFNRNMNTKNIFVSGSMLHLISTELIGSVIDPRNSDMKFKSTGFIRYLDIVERKFWEH